MRLAAFFSADARKKGRQLTKKGDDKNSTSPTATGKTAPKQITAKDLMEKVTSLAL